MGGARNLLVHDDLVMKTELCLQFSCILLLVNKAGVQGSCALNRSFPN